jgi:hypothetical protein
MRTAISCGTEPVTIQGKSISRAKIARFMRKQRRGVDLVAKSSAPKHSGRRDRLAATSITLCEAPEAARAAALVNAPIESSLRCRDLEDSFDCYLRRYALLRSAGASLLLIVRLY